MKNLIYFRSSSYGRSIYQTVILTNATLEDIKKEYLKDKPYCEDIFDRNSKQLNDKGYFTLPDSYNSMFVMLMDDFKETPNTRYINQ